MYISKLAKNKLPAIYQEAVKRLPKGKKVIIFWTPSRMSHMQKVIFEQSVTKVLSGAIQAAAKEEEGKIIHLAVDPGRIPDETIRYIANRWAPDREEIRIEYR